jgi:hypothetical protein
MEVVSEDVNLIKVAEDCVQWLVLVLEVLLILIIRGIINACIILPEFSGSHGVKLKSK